MKPNISFTLPGSDRILKILGGVILGLVVCNLLGKSSGHFLGHGRLLGFVPEFDLDAENNIPTYVSSLMLLAASLLLGMIAFVARRTETQFARHWTGLFLISAFMSLDETASLHERLGTFMRYFLDDPGGIFNFAWVIPGIGLLVLFSVFYVPFWAQLPSRWKKLFAASGIVYVSGGLITEMTGAAYADAIGKGNFLYACLVTVEESLEMAGASLFIYSLLEFLRAHVSAVRISFGDEEEPGEGKLYLDEDSKPAFVAANAQSDRPARRPETDTAA